MFKTLTEAFSFLCATVVKWLSFRYLSGQTNTAELLNDILKLSQGSSLILQNKRALDGKTSGSEML